VLREPQEHFYSDEPPREWRPVPRNRADRFDSTRLDTRRAAINAAHFVRATAYTQHEFWYLERAHEFLTQLGRTDEAAQLVEQNRHRFIGHYLRDPFFAARAREAADPTTELGLLAQAIQAQPNQWSAYYALARAQLRHRQPQLAQQTLLAYPQFRSKEAHPVGLSNEAGDAGTLLHKAGEAELARPLLELSLRLRTGAAAEMWSGIRLAMTNGDYRAAIDWAQQLHDRYHSEWGLTNVAMFSFMRGEADEGWRAFNEAAQTQAAAEPWLAALIGHRIAGAEDRTLVEFIQNWKRTSGPPQFEALLKEHFLFNMLMIDRPASEQSLRTVLAFGGHSGDRAYGILASGYDALRREDHANAAGHFTQLHNVLMNVSANSKRSSAYVLPYMTLALLRMDKHDEAQALVRSARQRIGTDFYTLMAQAFLDGHAGRAAQARTGLWEAFLERPSAADLPIPPTFQILEACEALLDLSGDDSYRVLLVDLARRQGRAWPVSWAFAFEAKYATDQEERLHALGTALFLDRRSERLTSFSASERNQAAAWFTQNNPFAGRDRKLQTAAR